MADVNVSVDADRHDVHQGRKARDNAESTDEDAKTPSFLKPHLSLKDTWKQTRQNEENTCKD